MQIKEHCWRYDTVQGAYFVKYYADTIQEAKVRNLHDRLEQVDFPYSLPITSRKESPYIVQPWVDGREADYRSREDRRQTLHMLQTLHETTAGWYISYMHEQRLVEKWRMRFEKFKEQKHALQPFMGAAAFEEICRQTSKALQQITPIITREKCVLHGDVVHHNFLLGTKPLLIDFDLACIGSPEEEVLLWMHRVLPHVDYQIDVILQEQPYTNTVLAYLHFLMFPNELLREWLYMLQVSPEKRPVLLNYLQEFTEEAVMYFPRVNNQIEAYKS